MAASVGTMVRHFQKDNQLVSKVDPDDSLPTTKQEEWVTKKTVEQTRKKQIETRVKRQLLLEDGHVVEDSGPMVTSSTTEDLQTEEKEATEHRTLDDPILPLLSPSPIGGSSSTTEDGTVVKETTERKVTSKEQKQSRLATEEVRHLGDIANEDVDRALKEGTDIRELIRQRQDAIASNPYQLSPVSKVVHQSSKHRKVTDTEDTTEVSRVKDGTIVKEITTKQEHDEYSHSSGSDSSDEEEGEKEITKEGSHTYAHTKNEDFVEYYKVPKGAALSEGVKVGEGMHYVSEDLSEERKGDWEPPSAWRPRVKVSPGPVGVGDRADVVTRRPLDLLAEEKARQSHTQKWWRSHFGVDDTPRYRDMGLATSRVIIPEMVRSTDPGLRSDVGVVPVRPPRHKPKMQSVNGRGKEQMLLQQRASSSSPMDRSSSISPAQPTQRFYLGEDPFRGSIYGRESEYPDTQPLSKSRGSRYHSQNHHRRSASPAEGRKVQFNGSTTLGRLSKSSTRLSNDSSDDLRTRTVPRRLASSTSPSNGTINVSIINQVNRRPLNRSQSFTVQGSTPIGSKRSTFTSSLRKDGDVHKSTPFLDTANSLKSPGLIRSLSRSQKDISNGYQESRTHSRVTNGGSDLFTTSSNKKTSDKNEWRLNGINSSNTPRWGSRVKEIPVKVVNSNSTTSEDKKSVFLRGLRNTAPELFMQLHGNDDGGSHKSTTPPPPLVRHSPSFRSSTSSGGYPEDINETVRVTTSNDDPNRLTNSDTVRRYCRRSSPGATYEATETHKVTKSRLREPDISNRGVVIEVRDWDRRH